jgi:4-aminobutyrate aminotransferase-like enzyme
VTPPLTTSDAEIAEGLAIIDDVLDIADTYYTGK